MRQDKIQDKEMPELSDTVSCERVGDLVAYLYGETNENEALDFQNHIVNCAECRTELSAFADVRGGIGAWRDEALNPIAVLAPDAVRQRAVVQVMTKRSALMALREFFSLAPLWLRGATAFAAVLFVALLFVTALRFFERSESPVVKQTPSSTPIVNEKPTTIDKAKDEVVVTVPTNTATNSEVSTESRQTKRTARTNSNRHAKAPDLSNEERSQLADLLIAAKEDEESMPRLDDLLSESN